METNKRAEQRSIQDYLSLGYLFLIICGLAKNIIYYGLLDINIIDYVSIVDVLLSPISYLVGSKYALIVVILIMLFFYLSVTKFPSWHKKYRDKKWYNRGKDMTQWDEYYAEPKSLETALPILAFTIVSFFLGTGLGGGLKNKDRIATNDYKADREIVFQNKEVIQVKLIGQSSQYIFYLFEDDPIIHITPIQGNIKVIKPFEKEEKE